MTAVDGPALYARIGPGYATHRCTEPRIAAQLNAALGGARTVLNVGAGAGSYEPADRWVLAVEPSPSMRAQRPPGAAPAVAARAEELPFDDGAVDAAMAVLSDHHWTDRRRGLRELRRVARRTVVVLTWDQSRADDFWLVRDYLPVMKALPGGLAFEEILAAIDATRTETVPVPHDCTDAFFFSHWRRPEAILDAEVRAATSVFARLPERDVEDALARLRADLASGAWHERNADLLERDTLDLGLRLAISER